MCKLMPGDVFGEVSFLLGGGASADVVAGTNLTLFMLEAVCFLVCCTVAPF